MKSFHYFILMLAVSSLNIFCSEKKEHTNINPNFDCFDLKFLAQTNNFVMRVGLNSGKTKQEQIDNVMKLEILALYNQDCRVRSSCDKRMKLSEDN